MEGGAKSVLLFGDETTVEEEHSSSTGVNRCGSLSSSRLMTPRRGQIVGGNTGRSDLASSKRGASSVARKCWIFPVEVPLCNSVLCGHATTALPPDDGSIEEGSVQLRAASEQRKVSSWVPRQAAAVVRQRKREARIGFMFESALVRKPPWRWRVECTNVPSDRRKILVPARAGGRSETAGRSELWDADSRLGAENCFRKTPTGCWVWTAQRSCGIDTARCGVLN